MLIWAKILAAEFFFLQDCNILHRFPTIWVETVKMVMKTITIQLIKMMIFSEEDIRSLSFWGHSFKKYASDEAYDFYRLGISDILIKLKSEVLTHDIVPMLEDLFSVFTDEECVKQRNNVLCELRKINELTMETCERLGYSMYDSFYPVFDNDKHPYPFLMREDGVNADCTGIILCTIPPDKITVAGLYTLEDELQKTLVNHPLAKALKVCVG